jgi:hypothetical protein
VLPSIALVLSVEMIRDGGSLAAAFQGGNGSEYWLFFRLVHRALPTGQLERLHYEQSVVVERPYGSASEVSWRHALVLLNQMRSQLRSASDLGWLETMVAVANAEGKLPVGMQRIVG